MPDRVARYLLLFLFSILTISCSGPVADSADLRELSWQEIEQEARGGDLTLMMWMGDPLINDYMNDYVIPEVKERFNIDLEIVSGQGTQVVSTLMAELEGSRRTSQIDQMWI
ncbi:MAG: hypothetical protein R6V27_08275, partial [Balneolaceae bacterium]